MTTPIRLIENQPHWRVLVVHHIAKIMGVLVHVEGCPFGSSRCWRKKTKGQLGTTAEASGQGREAV